MQKFIADLPLPVPQLLIGAGHKTHMALLCARKTCGGKAVILMRPTMPVSWFDLCLIPAHDNPPVRANVICTRGPLNQVHASPNKIPGKGLILAGGPSKHYSWDSRLLEDQIRQIISTDSERQWVLTDSPRTPETSKVMFSQLAATNIIYKPFSAVTRDWLADELATATVVWVTEDSVSMIYEALTAGAKVGLLEIPSIRHGRLAKANHELIEEGIVVSYKDWRRIKKMPTTGLRLDESARCAQLLLKYFSLATVNDCQ